MILEHGFGGLDTQSAGAFSGAKYPGYRLGLDTHLYILSL